MIYTHRENHADSIYAISVSFCGLLLSAWAARAPCDRLDCFRLNTPVFPFMENTASF